LASVVPDEHNVENHPYRASQSLRNFPDDPARFSDCNDGGILLIGGAILEIRESSPSGVSATNHNGSEGNSVIRARGAVVQISQASSGFGSGDGRLSRATVAEVAGGSPHRTPRRTVGRLPHRLVSQPRSFDTPQYYEIWRDAAAMTTFLNSREYLFTYSLFFFLE
jgi:hypothetical protein